MNKQNMHELIVCNEINNMHSYLIEGPFNKKLLLLFLSDQFSMRTTVLNG